MRRVIFLLALTLTFIACSNSYENADQSASFEGGETYGWNASEKSMEEYDETEDESYKDQEEQRQIPDQVEGEPEIGLKIIKEGDVSLQVKDYGKTRGELDLLIKTNKGYLASENEAKSKYNITNTLVIRLPAKNFDGFLSALSGMDGKLIHKNIEARDVTRQYVDIQSRLKTKKQVRDKYESFLKNAKNVEELLAVEEKVRLLTEEIEAKEAELRYLSDKVKYSTLRLSLNQPLEYSIDAPEYTGPSFLERWGQSFKDGWQGILTLIIGLTSIWPLILIAILIFVLLRRMIIKANNPKVSSSNNKTSKED